MTNVKHGCFIPLILILFIASGCAQPQTEAPTLPPTEEAELETTAPETTPSVPVILPSPISLWAESEVGPVYAEETHYAKPSPDGKYLYIFSMDTRNIIVLDIKTRTIVQEIKMPGFWSQATEMIFSSDGQWMYTLNAAAVGECHVVVIDTKTHKIDYLIPLPQEYEPWGKGNIALSPDEEFLYVCGGHGIYRINFESGQVIKVSNIETITFLDFTSAGEYLLGANIATNSLDLIDPDDIELVESIYVGDSPRYICISQDNQRVYVSNWESDDVSVVDLGTRRVIATIPVGVNPLGMTVTPDGSTLYVAVTAQALEHTAECPYKVAVVDTKTFNVIKEIRSGKAPRFVNISPDGTKVYVNEERGKVHIIDTAGHQLIDSIFLTGPASYRPDNIAVTANGSKLLVFARGTGQALVVDTITHECLAHFDVSSSAIAISSDGQQAYIPGSRFIVLDIPLLTAKYVDIQGIFNGNSQMVLSRDERIAYIVQSQGNLLQVVDLQNWQLIANVPVGNMGVTEFDLAITPDGSKIFVCNGYSKNISVVSTAENKVIDTISLESIPDSVDFSPDGKIAYIIELESEVRRTQVIAIDVSTHKVIQRWDREPIGFGNPHDIAISPDGKHAYFAGTDGEIVVVLDIEDGATRYIDVGLNPRNLDLTQDGRLLYVSNTDTDDITVIDTQTERVVDRIPIQVEEVGFIYASIADSRGKSIDMEIRFVPYDQGVQGGFQSWGFGAPSHRLDGCWVPVPEGDYMLWVNTNPHKDMRFVSQIHDGIKDFNRRNEASRIRVMEGQITSVNIVLQEGHQVSGILVDRSGKPVSTGGSIVNTQTGASIGGYIGFGSGGDGRFWVVVPEGVYDLYFEGIRVASGLSIYEDIDLGQVTFSHS